MRPPETAKRGRVDIALPIRLPMMQAMMRRPPQDSLLRRTLRQKCHRELRNPAKLVASMPEIPVIAGRDSKHADRVGHGEPGQENFVGRVHHTAKTPA